MLSDGRGLILIFLTLL